MTAVCSSAKCLRPSPDGRAACTCSCGGENHATQYASTPVCACADKNHSSNAMPRRGRPRPRCRSCHRAHGRASYHGRKAA